MTNLAEVPFPQPCETQNFHGILNSDKKAKVHLRIIAKTH